MDSDLEFPESPASSQQNIAELRREANYENLEMQQRIDRQNRVRSSRTSGTAFGASTMDMEDIYDDKYTSDTSVQKLLEDMEFETLSSRTSASDTRSRNRMALTSDVSHSTSDVDSEPEPPRLHGRSNANGAAGGGNNGAPNFASDLFRQPRANNGGLIDMISNNVAAEAAASNAQPPPRGQGGNFRGRGGSNRPRPSNYASNRSSRSANPEHQNESDAPVDFAVLGIRTNDSFIHDRESITAARATEIVNTLKKTFRHWSKKLTRPPADANTPALTAQQVENNARLYTNAWKLIVEVVKQTNFSEMVESGILSADSSRLVGEGASHSTREAFHNDVAQVRSVDIPITASAIYVAVREFKKSLYAMFQELLNRAPPETPARYVTEATNYWSSTIELLDGATEMVSGSLRCTFPRRADLARHASEINQIQIQDSSDVVRFLFFISRRLAALNFRRGPKSKSLYREHFVNNEIPSHYWLPVMTIEKFISDLISPVNGPDVMQLYCKHVQQVSQVAHLITQGDDGLFPTVYPQRGLIGFDNGILDNVANRFYHVGSKAYKKYIDDSPCYKYLYNFFAGDFNSEGFDLDTGEFDWIDRLAPFNTRGFPDWDNPDSMPAKHWFRKLRIPILSDNFAVQEFTLHTLANLLFALGRLQHSINDNLQMAIFAEGRPGSGKSTLFFFAIFFVPSSFRAIISPMLEGGFALQQLIGQDDKFVRHLGVVLDMNGKFALPAATVNNLVTGEWITTDVKHDSQRTAKADMPMAFAGNKFFQYPASEMPPVIRRFWTFMFQHIPATSDFALNSEQILKAMPDYIRMTNEVYHEFWRLKKMSANSRYRSSTDPWLYASKQLKKTRLETMVNVSSCSSVIAAEDWIVFKKKDVYEPSDVTSLDTLRYVSMVHTTHCGGNANTARQLAAPKIDKVVDAIRMVYPECIVEEWNTEDPPARWKNQPDILQNGLTGQFGEEININRAKYALGLRIVESKLDYIRQYLPTSHPGYMASPPTTADQESTEGTTSFNFAIPAPITSRPPKRPQVSVPLRTVSANAAPSTEPTQQNIMHVDSTITIPSLESLMREEDDDEDIDTL